MPGKNAQRKKQKLERTETALKKIKAPVGSPEYVEQTRAILEKSKLQVPIQNRLKSEFHLPQAVTLPRLPELSQAQKQLLGKSMLAQLLGFELTEAKHRAAGAKMPLGAWYAYGYDLYVAVYNRLCNLAQEPEKKKQPLTLLEDAESIKAKEEVNLYLNDKARSPGIYAGAVGYPQQYGFFAPLIFLKDMPQPFLGKLVLAVMAHMVDFITQFALAETAKTAVNDTLDKVPFGSSAHGDMAHMLYSNFEDVKPYVRVVTFPVLPSGFIQAFNAAIGELPQKLRVENDDCCLGPIYQKFYAHLSEIQRKYGFNPGYLAGEDLERLNGLPLTEFYLEEMLKAFFTILQAAQTHFLPTDEDILAEEAKMASAGSSSSSSSSSSVLPRGVSAGQLSAAYASPLPPTDEKDEMAKIEAAFRPK